MSREPELTCPCCGSPTKIVKGREYRVGRKWVPERECSKCTVRGAKPHMERRTPAPTPDAQSAVDDVLSSARAWATARESRKRSLDALVNYAQACRKLVNAVNALNEALHQIKKQVGERP